jgi:hypothetical protein
MTGLSKPLDELPAFLSMISMVADDEREIVKGFTRAERKSPARYEPAKQIFFRILSGDLTYQAGIAQALEVSDPVERNCAVSVLRVANLFLKTQRPGRIARLPFIQTTLPNGLELDVGPVWVRDSDGERLLVLHFWRNPLTPRQLSAAGAILRLALLQNRREFALLELDLISAAIPEGSEARRFVNYHWKQLAPLTEDELFKFSQKLRSAWKAYQLIGPRKIKQRLSGSRLL